MENILGFYFVQNLSHSAERRLCVHQEQKVGRRRAASGFVVAGELQGKHQHRPPDALLVGKPLGQKFGVAERQAEENLALLVGGQDVGRGAEEGQLLLGHASEPDFFQAGVDLGPDLGGAGISRLELRHSI